MRRLIAISVLVAGLAGAAIAAASGDGGGTYEVRAIFDTGSFLVPGEDVRIAGSKVGSVSDVDVTFPDRPGEPGDWVNADHSTDPGKAVVVLKIDDAGFQDWRQDASCLIRPQSLLGEKYVDCQPTQPRAPGTAAPPPLETIPDGQPGAGQHFLPLQNNGQQVDLDLVNNINDLPSAERFRIILNELGIGLAARGKDLAAIAERADPALRETNQVLAILAQQNHQLARLQTDSDAVLAPLARERRHVSGFFANAGATAQATAERSRDLEAGFQKFPRFLSELRSTMTQLQAFGDQATPTVSKLGVAAPALTQSTEALGPFAHSSRRSLVSLGKAAEVAGPDLKASDPVLRDLNSLAHSAVGPASTLKELLASLQKTNGYDRLMDFIYNTAGSINGFDQYGHFLRVELLLSNCVVYQTTPLSGCSANFAPLAKASKASQAAAPSPSPQADATAPRGGGSEGSHTAKPDRGMQALHTLLDWAVGPGSPANAYGGLGP